MRVLWALVAMACAGHAAAWEQAEIERKMGRLVPITRIDAIEPAAVPGWLEVRIGAEILYVTEDGEYLMSGRLFSTADSTDLGERTRSKVRKQALATLSPQAHIVFAPKEPRARVTVFTAIDCGYCRQLHRSIDGYLERGIAIDYIVVPRSAVGTPTEKVTRGLYCAADPAVAFVAALEGGREENPDCAAEGYQQGLAVAKQLGIGSTPTLVFADGSMAAGFLQPEDLARRLGLSEQP